MNLDLLKDTFPKVGHTFGLNLNYRGSCGEMAFLCPLK